MSYDEETQGILGDVPTIQKCNRFLRCVSVKSGWFACSKPIIVKFQIFYPVCDTSYAPTFEDPAAYFSSILDVFQKVRVFFHTRYVESYLESQRTA
jgi:hypothetical protein